MHNIIKKSIQTALNEMIEEGFFTDLTEAPEPILSQPRTKGFGDLSTNICMKLGRSQRKNPGDIALVLSKKLASCDVLEKSEVAAPGFVNFFIKKSCWAELLSEILGKGAEYGRLTLGEGAKVQVEFVSANPTGPLHIGHGRGAAVGDAISSILKRAGYDVTKEFYINDMGRQIDVLGRSVYLRASELEGKAVVMPEDAYHGHYIKDVAAKFIAEKGVAFMDMAEEEAVDIFKEYASEALLGGIREDLKDFNVEFDVWYSEKSLYEKDLVKKAMDELRKRGFIYEQEGAVWFRSTDFGDDKDRVLIKADGARTYFASDIAYHGDKLDRGFTQIINVWGADHHGYEARVRAFIEAMGREKDALKVVFIQLVALLREGEPVAMGKRSGEFVTLRQVMDEVGSDAARFFFLTRKSDAHLDFDLELAKKQTPENPVFYVQYCYARIQSIFGFAKEKGFTAPDKFSPEALECLNLPEEIELIKHLANFESVIEKSASGLEPHRVTFYLMELAGLFHPYYNKNRVVTEDRGLTEARLLLLKAAGGVTRIGLKLLGISAPEKM
ncbi:MAG: arginine--tRNA ligase [Thermodesulfobacteriota bacterium]